MKTGNSTIKPRASLRLAAIILLGLGVTACVSARPTTPAAVEILPLSPTETSVPVETPSLPPSTPVVFVTEIPDPAGFTWAEYVTGLNEPLDIQSAGDGSGRLFVVERRGRIRIISDAQIVPEEFLKISDRISTSGQEQGLLGLAFHPDYLRNGYFFVNYTDPAGDTVIARFQVSTENPNRADPQSELILLQVNQPFSNHNGGGLAFGPDGYLYIGLGDGGSGGDPAGNGQNPDTYLGKLLRLDVDSANSVPEIWSTGLRNPWRFSFDPLTGDLYIADVGQSAWEEIDFLPAGNPAGLNFGWNIYEGSHSYNGQPLEGVTYTAPVAEYSHDQGCSVTGGFVYRGSALPEWQGIYIFGDFCNGRVFGLLHSDAQTWQPQLLFETGTSLSSFGVDEAGELYLADFASGRLLRLQRR